MNVFYLDENPIEAARCHYNKHLNKMILESAQLLSSAWWMLSPETAKDIYEVGKIYKKAYPNHPCAVWVRECYENFLYVKSLALELNRERLFRNDNIGADHSSAVLIQNMPIPPLPVNGKITPPYQAVVNKQDDPIEAYRDYYAHDKKHLFGYGKREVPAWLIERKNLNEPSSGLLTYR